MHISFWQLGWRTLWRDVRAGELRLLMLAVTLAVAALSAVGFFADRLQGGLQRDARQLLGGDAVIATDNAPTPEFAQTAQQSGLQAVLTLSFPTMARADDGHGSASKLIALKAVDTGYPLRGSLRTARAPDAPDAVVQGIPEAGHVWVDAGLLDALGLQVGDALLLGNRQLRIGAVLTQEPDRGAGFMNFAPRVLMNRADLAATELVQPASRINYRLAVAGDAARVRAYVQWAQGHVQEGNMRGVRVETLDGGRPEMAQTLERANKFLNLVALLAALLCAVAVALAARSFASRHLDDCAMLRVLGLPHRTMAASYGLEFLLAGLAASSLGVLLGYAVHYLFVALLAGLVGAELPAPSAWPVAMGLGMGLTLLLAFGLPPVLQLAQVPALRVIRRDLGQPRAASLVVLGTGLLGFAALLLLASRDWWLGLISVGGFAGAALLFAGVAAVSVWLLRRMVNENTAPRWLVLATRQVGARPGLAVLQVSALAVGLLALVLLVLLRTDLIDSWRKATPPNAPNRFAINIQPDQADAVRSALNQAGVASYDWFPMFRGRLVAVNGKAVSVDDYQDDRAKRLVDREFNLSHTASQPEHNSLTQGRWQAEEPDAVSVEQGLADTLGLQLGDMLQFDIAGQMVQGRITSLRKVDWTSMRANFFVLFPKAAMPEVPVTYLTAFRAPERTASSGSFDNALVRQFPNLTVVDLSSTLAQIQRVLDQVIQAVEFLFAFTLAAGIVVLLAAVGTTREDRAREFAVLRALGAGSPLLRQVQRAELMGLGFLAGLLAAAVASALGWALARYVFAFDWMVSPWVLLGGALAGAALAGLAGWWSLREVLQRPVVQTLRQRVD
ncbi:ABC transporter permease [Curvibacter sp. CHRR-16]|uniref:ABC transporter permease n=1 Tax=Curvibacter sp. CHRR-16 TaxID=2835872 RepID=UPI001BD99D32|nr:FtsX-like permease family protein [Curvibacter sp. CHRR-16]MBT0569178.1 ABC transporter permease [Curvibacter sp. CHRR-16]